jgi:beta-lactam-binding protein with PASTA domain
MYNFLRYSLLALILLTAALISGLTAMRIAIHGREVEVPKLVGLPPDEAEQQGLESGLLVQVVNRYYSASIPEGRILSQSPEAGVKVRRGWRVRLAASLGPQRVVIPNVVGQSLRSAELSLRRHGLEPGEIALLTLPGLPPDQVIAQSPAASAVGIANPKIGLLVTPPPAPPEHLMPSVVGSPIAEAVRLLEKAGIRVPQTPQAAPPQLMPASSKSEQPTTALPAILRTAEPNAAPNSPATGAPGPVATAAPRIVVSQTPPPGTKITSGIAVELQVR